MSDPSEPTGRRVLQLGSLGAVGCLTFSILIALVVVALFFLIRALL